MNHICGNFVHNVRATVEKVSVLVFHQLCKLIYSFFCWFFSWGHDHDHLCAHELRRLCSNCSYKRQRKKQNSNAFLTKTSSENVKSLFAMRKVNIVEPGIRACNFSNCSQWHVRHINVISHPRRCEFVVSTSQASSVGCIHCAPFGNIDHLHCRQYVGSMCLTQIRSRQTHYYNNKLIGLLNQTVAAACRPNDASFLCVVVLTWTQNMFVEGYWMCPVIHMEYSTHQWIEWIGRRQFFFSKVSVLYHLLFNFFAQTNSHDFTSNILTLDLSSAMKLTFCVLTAQLLRPTRQQHATLAVHA